MKYGLLVSNFLKPRFIYLCKSELHITSGVQPQCLTLTFLLSWRIVELWKSAVKIVPGFFISCWKSGTPNFANADCFSFSHKFMVLLH